MKRWTRTLTSAALLSCLAAPSFAESVVPDSGFDQFLIQLRDQAVEQGISEATMDHTMAQVKVLPRSIELDRRQPEGRLTLEKYLTGTLPDWKIKQARDLYDKHEDLLQEIAKAYGVQARYIVALWGLETHFGGYTGRDHLPSTLATLAYEGRRAEFFSKQFIAAMQVIDEGHITSDKMYGSWAGAMGQIQFMPSSFLAYAEDYNGDGKKDIWGNHADIFASAANYLRQQGWQDDQTWGRQVSLAQPVAEELTGLKVQKSLAQWQELGVRRTDGTALPTRDLQASLIMPDGPDGRIYLVYDNFRALMHWNRSTYFATSVGILSDAIVFRR